MDRASFTDYRNAVEARLIRSLPRGAEILIHEINRNEISETHSLSKADDVTRLVERTLSSLMVDCELGGSCRGALYAVSIVIRPRYRDVHPTTLLSASVWVRECLSREWPGIQSFRVSAPEVIFVVGVDPRLSAMTRDGAAVVQSRLIRTAQEVLEFSGLDPLWFWIAPSPAFPLPKPEAKEVRHAA